MPHHILHPAPSPSPLSLTKQHNLLELSTRSRKLSQKGKAKHLAVLTLLTIAAPGTIQRCFGCPLPSPSPSPSPSPFSASSDDLGFEKIGTSFAHWKDVVGKGAEEGLRSEPGSGSNSGSSSSWDCGDLGSNGADVYDEQSVQGDSPISNVEEEDELSEGVWFSLDGLYGDRQPMRQRRRGVVSTLVPSSTLAYTTSAEPTTSTTTTSPLPTAPSTPLPLPPTTSFPSPFDSSLSYELSDSCLAFFTAYLSDGEGGAREMGCGRNFGLLISTSSGWAEIIRNETLLNAALSEICLPSATANSITNSSIIGTATSTTSTSAPSSSASTKSTSCSSYYASLATDIQQSGKCATDIAGGNLVALQGLYGFQNYDLMQSAACLTDDTTGAYCYLEAMTTDSPDDGYLYNLPQGIALPSTTVPTCSACSSSLMSLFAAGVANSTNPPASVLSGVMTNATSLIDAKCGSSFVAVADSAKSVTGGTRRSVQVAAWGCIGSLAVAVFVFGLSSVAGA